MNRDICGKCPEFQDPTNIFWRKRFVRCKKVIEKFSFKLTDAQGWAYETNARKHEDGPPDDCPFKLEHTVAE